MSKVNILSECVWWKRHRSLLPYCGRNRGEDTFRLFGRHRHVRVCNIKRQAWAQSQVFCPLQPWQLFGTATSLTHHSSVVFNHQSDTLDKTQETSIYVRDPTESLWRTLIIRRYLRFHHNYYIIFFCYKTSKSYDFITSYWLGMGLQWYKTCINRSFWHHNDVGRVWEGIIGNFWVLPKGNTSTRNEPDKLKEINQGTQNRTTTTLFSYIGAYKRPQKFSPFIQIKMST